MFWFTFVFSWLAFTAPNALEHQCEKRAMLHSSQYDALLSAYFADYQTYQDRWLIVPFWDEDGLSVLQLDERGHITTVVPPSMRLGNAPLDGYAVSTEGNLWLTVLGNPTIFVADLNASEPSLRPAFITQGLRGDFVRIDDAHALAGDTDLHLRIISPHDDLPPWPLDKMNPEDREHPVIHVSNMHKAVPAWDGERLAVGYTLTPKVFIYDQFKTSPKRKVARILFEGYLEPPDTWPEGLYPNYEKRRAYVNTFHRLNRLMWRDGVLYGEFRRGYSSGKVWTSLYPKLDKRYFYNNDQQAIDLLAIGEDSVLLGHRQETEDGIVTLCLFTASSLP